KSILALALALMMIDALAGCGKNPGGKSNPSGTPSDPSQGSDLSALNGTYDMVVWVSESDGVTDLTKQQIDRFCSENPGITINARIEGITEAESASQMITSVEDGADLYCFAQDQLVRLVQAGALAKLGEATQKKITELNDKTSVLASTVGGVMYCYPLTSDNGYYMYYDKSVIPENHLDSLEDIIADCEAAGKMFSMELTTSAWYNAAFFFATGCVSEWQFDDTGAYTGVNDTFNSENGLIALKGMQKLLKSKAFNSSSAGADFAAGVPSAVVVSGTWASSAVKEALGDNYAATDLPSFTVDGKTYHLGSYSGCKLIGVKPQTDSKRAALLQQLALYLSNETCQLERFNLVGWGPSNLTAQKNEKVASDIALSALAKLAEYAIPQGQIHGSWWDIAKAYAVSAKEANTDAELKAALQTYEDTIKGLFQMSVDEKEAWSVIGSMNGDGWATDIAMVCDSEGVWHSDAIKFVAGDEFKVRQGKSWDVNIGSDGSAGGPNFVVNEEGYGFVTFKYNKDTNTGEIKLEKFSDIYGFTIIGNINGDGWSIDLPMEIQPDGSWLTTEAYDLTTETEFKARQGKNWDVNSGDNGENFKVAEAGTYFIKLTADKKIELIKK
ncbi:MAG: extracellular solute-binding protein, partial [Lachnospiraceae bacterium]|nr:extracellular solute-binding protein [Lachnospiraceae bacterium]